MVKTYVYPLVVILIIVMGNVQYPYPDSPVNLHRGNKIMQISEAGKHIIKNFEGLRLETYNNGTGIPTIGYGHTGSDVTPGLVITVERAEELLSQDLKRFEKGVTEFVTVPLTQNQFDALVSFAYNVGLMAFRSSTLRRLLNQKDFQGAVMEFGRWVRGGGRVLGGLVIRRAEEAKLFLG